MENENNGYALWENIFGKQIEDNRMREAEKEIRYAQRRNEKHIHRQRIEQAAGKICAMIDAESEKTEHKLDDITMLATALNHVAAAVSVTETYAESMPYSSLSIGY